MVGVGRGGLRYRLDQCIFKYLDISLQTSAIQTPTSQTKNLIFKSTHNNTIVIEYPKC